MPNAGKRQEISRGDAEGNGRRDPAVVSVTDKARMTGRLRPLPFSALSREPVAFASARTRPRLPDSVWLEGDVSGRLRPFVILDLIRNPPQHRRHGTRITSATNPAPSLRVMASPAKAEGSHLQPSSCRADRWRLLRRSAPRNDETGRRIKSGVTMSDRSATGRLRPFLPAAKPWGGGPRPQGVVEGPPSLLRQCFALPPPHRCATGRIYLRNPAACWRPAFVIPAFGGYATGSGATPGSPTRRPMPRRMAGGRRVTPCGW